MMLKVLFRVEVVELGFAARSGIAVASKANIAIVVKKYLTVFLFKNVSSILYTENFKMSERFKIRLGIKVNN